MSGEHTLWLGLHHEAYGVHATIANTLTDALNLAFIHAPENLPQNLAPNVVNHRLYL